MQPAGAITAVVLAGGQGLRMGGVDKGLVPFGGQPLARHALARLRAQQGGLVGPIAINANRHLPTYEAMGVPVWPDSLSGQPGPLAGFLTGLTQCRTPLLLTVPCDTPLFPLDLAVRLHQALLAQDADIAMAAAPESDGHTRTQPVFCLLRAGLRGSLAAFMQAGGRKIDAWTALHRQAIVGFDQPGDGPRAFANANTQDELRALEAATP